jgi:elongation factor G
MAKYKAQNIRNVVLLGHTGTGKTSLLEEMLFATKANNRVGSVREGNSLSDFLPDEVESGSSIDLSCLYANFGGVHFQFFDAPGRTDFMGQTIMGLFAADAALVQADGFSGLQVNTRKAWQVVASHGKPAAVVISKMDVENVDLPKVLDSIQETFGKQCVPFFYPDKTGSGLSKVFSVLKPEAGAPDAVKKYHDQLVEAVVEADEDMMMRYLDGADVSADVAKNVGLAIRKRSLVPVLMYGQKGSVGIKEIVETIKDYFPSPEDFSTVKIEESKTDEEGNTTITHRDYDVSTYDGTFLGQVVRVINDEHKGRMAFVKVLAGQLDGGSNIYNVRSGKSPRTGKFVKIFGARHDDVDSVGKGEIFAPVKVEDLALGDTLSDGKFKDKLAGPKYPTPMVALAVKPKTHNDEQKISTVLQRIIAEDPCFRTELDNQTKEMIIYGLSELHLNVVLKRMERIYGVNVDTKLPRISYRETITRTVSDYHRHKKQSGGSGEFAEVHIHMRPYKEGNFNFVNGLKGDNVRRQFVPSVEKGCRGAMDEGVLTGSPVNNIEVEFFDGKDHPVDGKDSAFQKAAKEAFKKCFLAAGPVLLEPIVEVEAVFPSEFAGDVNQYVNAHRGRIAGMDHAGAEQVLRASLPLAEVQTFSTDLRSMTQGQGSYSMEFSGYEIMPANEQNKIIEKFKALRKDEE